MANSLKDLISSVDWSKIMNSSDARNAAIGSALGGAMLGGAGLVAVRDPEESKMAPVKDALLGAVLGGVAGYGIPKGIALFGDSGGMAPDNDKLENHYLSSAAKGFALGSVPVLGSQAFAATRAIKRLANRQASLYGRKARNAEIAFNNVTESARREMLRDGQISDATLRSLRAAGMHRSAYTDGILKKELPRLIREGKYREAIALTKMRTDALFGLNRGIADEIAREPFSASGKSRIGDFFRNFSSGAHYARKPVRFGALTLGNLGPKARMLLRAGKYGAAGGTAALLYHYLFGPGPKDNFKN